MRYASTRRIVTASLLTATFLLPATAATATTNTPDPGRPFAHHHVTHPLQAGGGVLPGTTEYITSPVRHQKPALQAGGGVLPGTTEYITAPLHLKVTQGHLHPDRVFDH